MKVHGSETQARTSKVVVLTGQNKEIRVEKDMVSLVREERETEGMKGLGDGVRNGKVPRPRGRRVEGAVERREGAVEQWKSGGGRRRREVEEEGKLLVPKEGVEEKEGIKTIKAKYNSIAVRGRQTHQQFLAKEVAPLTPNVLKRIGIGKAKIRMQTWLGRKTGTEHSAKVVWNPGEGGDLQGGLQMGSKINGSPAHRSMEGKQEQTT